MTSRSTLRQRLGLQQIEVADNAVQRRAQLMADGGQEHRFGLAGLLRRRRHLLQRLFHLHAGADVHQHANRHIFVTVARVDKADLQVVVVAGHHIDEIRLLFANDARNAIAIFVGQQVDVVVRQFVTQDIGAVADAQDTDAHRCRSDDLAVELLVLFQAKGVVLRRQEHFTLKQPRQREQHDGRQQVQQQRVEDQHFETFYYAFHRQRIDDAQRRRRQHFLQDQIAIIVDIAEVGVLCGIAVERSGIAIAVRQAQHRLVVLIQQRDADRQVAGGNEILQPNGLFDAQQRLQLVADINRRQHIQIADVRPLRIWG